MSVHVNLFTVILLLGILQGFILGLMLLFSRNEKQNKYFLAAFILVLAYDMFGTFCWSAGLNVRWADLLDTLFPYTFIFTLGPSFFLYIRTTFQTENLPFKTIFKVYLPAIVDFLIRLAIITYAILYNHRLLTGVNPNRVDGLYHPAAELLLLLVFWSYLAAAIRLFRHKSLAVSDEAYPAAEQQLAGQWIKTLLAVMTGVALVWTLTILVTMLFHLQTLGHIVPFETIVIMLIYWIGFKGYQNTRVVYIWQQQAVKSYREKVTDGEAEDCIRLLKRLMDSEKLYLDPELTVTHLADQLALNVKVVSAVLNGPLHKGFSNFVNEYRVLEVKEQLLKPENEPLTLFGIASNCGFNSQATFQRVFRQFTGMSPSAFRKNSAQIRI